MIQAHKQLQGLLQEAEKLARELHEKGCYVEPIVLGLRDMNARVADRIRSYERPATVPATAAKPAKAIKAATVVAKQQES